MLKLVREVYAALVNPPLTLIVFYIFLIICFILFCVVLK